MLTGSQLQALIDNLGVIRYQRDSALLRYHFAKLSEEQIKALAENRKAEENPLYTRAWATWVAGYNLPEYRKPRVDQSTAQEFMHALKKRRVPNWVLSIAPFEEIQEVANEAEGVRT